MGEPLVQRRRGAARDLRLACGGGGSSRSVPLLQLLAQIARDYVRGARIDTIWHYKPEVRDSWKSRLNNTLGPRSPGAPRMTVPGGVIAQRPAINDSILARAASHVTAQVETVPMTLNGIQLPVIVREWSMRKVFKPCRRKLSAVLGKKRNDARVYEVFPHTSSTFKPPIFNRMSFKVRTLSTADSPLAHYSGGRLSQSSPLDVLLKVDAPPLLKQICDRRFRQGIKVNDLPCNCPSRSPPTGARSLPPFVALVPALTDII
jgi:hypothetical protein